MIRQIINIKTTFPTFFRVVFFKTPYTILVPENTIKRDKCQVESEYIPSPSSIARTKMLIRDLVLANDFDLFCTFTFNPKKVDRFSYDKCWKVFQTWVRNQHIHSPDIKYLVIPEQHKNKAWHFHALVGNYNGNIVFSNKCTKSGKKIYNIKSYRAGFSTATTIEDKQRASSYVMKYITKDIIKTYNQRRFTCSQNLYRPVREINAHISRNKSGRMVFENENISIFEFPIPFY